MRDPIRIMATLYLTGPFQTLTSINTPFAYEINNHTKTVSIHSDQIELTGEYQDEELLLWGHGNPETWRQWSSDLEKLVSQGGIDSYQIDLFEEDGRLIKRIMG